MKPHRMVRDAACADPTCSYRAELGMLIDICDRLHDEYRNEEDEHGFPFNLKLRAAHRELWSFLASHSATDESHLPETGEQSSGEDDPIQRQHEWLERIPNPARSSHESAHNLDRGSAAGSRSSGATNAGATTATDPDGAGRVATQAPGSTKGRAPVQDTSKGERADS